MAISTELRLLRLTAAGPGDPGCWPKDRRRVPEEEPATRRRGLALAGIPAREVHSLGVEPLHAPESLPELAYALAAYLAEEPAPVLLSHPYEGGHPDHDSAAFLVKAAAALLRRHDAPTPFLFEMTSYHQGPVGFRAGEFLEEGVLVHRNALTHAQQELKRRMLDAHPNQRERLSRFAFASESFRPAPPYRFDRPPHPGRLHYELMGWTTFARWSRSVALAAKALGLDLAEPL